MGDGDASADAGRAEVLPTAEYAEEGGSRAVIGAKQLRHFLENVVLRRPAEVESYRIVTDEVTESHEVAKIIRRGRPP